MEKLCSRGSRDPFSSNDDFAVVRYNVDGSLDTSFGGTGKVTTDISGTYDHAHSVALQTDGKIVVAGSAEIGGKHHLGLVRYNTNGTLDTTFNGTGRVTTAIGSGHAVGESVAVQTDGKIVVAGESYATGVPNDIALVRYNADGTLDTTFNGTGKVTIAIGSSDDYGLSVLLQGDGKIVVGGYSNNGSNGDDFAVVRCNANGTLDTSFNGTGKVTTAIGSGGDVGISAVLQRDGKIVVAGLSDNGSNNNFAAVRYNTDGTLDTSFNGTGKVTTAVGSGTAVGESVVVQGDGKIVVAGYSNAAFKNYFAVVRHNANGTLDTSFNGTGKVSTAFGSGDANGTSVAVQSDGNIVVAGYVFLDGKYQFAVARYEGDPLTISISGSQPVNLGSPVTFSVGSATPNPLSYQWKKDGVDIPGATASAYTIPSVQPWHIGEYSVAVTYSGGSATSGAALLEINEVPTAIWRGLIAYYPFDGNADDKTVFARHGAVHGASLSADRSGNPSQAYSFDGVSNYAAADASINDVTNTFTVSMWFKTATAHRDERYANFILLPSHGETTWGGGSVGTGISAGTDWIKVWEHSHDYRPVVLASQGSFTAWTHVTLVYTNRVPSLYVNGVFAGTGGQSPRDPVRPSNGQQLNAFNEVGGFGGGKQIGGDSYFFPGQIDDVRIYNRALSPSEVQQLNGLEAPDTTAPVVTAPVTQVVEANSAEGAVVNYPAATATDNVEVTSVTYSQETGTSFPLGMTTVTVTAKDAANNTGTATFTVTVRDTMPPTASVPPALSVNAGPTGTAALGDLTPNVMASDLVGVTGIVQSPDASTVRPLGSYPVSFTVSDAAGNSKMLQTTVTVAFHRSAPATVTVGVQSGQPAPGGTVLSTFGAPAMSDFRDLAARATILAGRTKLAGIFVIDGAGTGSLPVYQSGPVPGITTTGVTFKSFMDPVIAPDGSVAFAGKVQGGGVKTTVDCGVWTDAFGNGLELVLREGSDVPGLPAGAKFKAVTSLSLRDGELLGLLTLAPAKGLVTTGDDTVLLRMTGASMATVQLREGDEVPGLFGSKIKTFSVLSPALGSHGHGRWHAEGVVVAKVGLVDGRTLLVKIAPDGGLTLLLSTADPAMPVNVLAQWKAFGLPAVGSAGAGFVVAATLKPNAGGVTAKDDTALLFSPDGTAWNVFARESGAAPMAPAAAGLLYASFFDPVMNDVGQVAYLATLQGAGIKAGNKTGLFCGTTDHLRMRARLGDLVPDESGTATAAVWSKFISFALPSGTGAGVIFLAETSGGDTTAKNKRALWAVDSTGTLRRLLRTNDALTVGGSPITGLTLLTAVPGAFGATRSYNATGSVALLATFADKTQGLLRVDVP